MLRMGLDQLPSFAMTDKDREMMDLVRGLRLQLTLDFRPTERRI